MIAIDLNFYSAFVRSPGRIIALLLAPFLIWGTARFTHHQTKGFRLAKLCNNQSPFASDRPIQIDALSKEALTQDYFYLDRGFQSFSFVSSDGRFVLKLFNNLYQNRLRLLASLPLKHLKEENYQKMEKTFTSYQIAKNVLCEETKLICLAPKGTQTSFSVTIFDNLNIAHKLDLKTCAFALQRKIELSHSFFAKCAQDQDFARAKKALQSLVTLINGKMDKGIADSDLVIRTNIGFIEGEAVQIDLGPFSMEEKAKTASYQKKRLDRCMLPLRHFFEEHHPSLLPYYYEVLDET